MVMKIFVPMSASNEDLAPAAADRKAPLRVGWRRLALLARLQRLRGPVRAAAPADPPAQGTQRQVRQAIQER